MITIERVRKEIQEYEYMQYSWNPYYVCLRFFGANWLWSISELKKIEKVLLKKEKMK